MFALEGLWLIGALAVVYFVGVFTAQWAKDKLAGIPSELRTALRATEAAAKNDLLAAKSKVVAETATLLATAKARVAAEVSPQPPSA